MDESGRYGHCLPIMNPHILFMYLSLKYSLWKFHLQPQILCFCVVLIFFLQRICSQDPSPFYYQKVSWISSEKNILAPSRYSRDQKFCCVFCFVCTIIFCRGITVNLLLCILEVRRLINLGALSDSCRICEQAHISTTCKTYQELL